MVNKTDKYKKLMEYIMNSEMDSADSLMHEIIVEHSRELYADLMNEADVNEFGMEDQSDDMQQDIDGDHAGMDMHSDEEGEEGAEDNFGGDEFGGEEAGDDEGVEDRIVDLETALDELKAEFDKLMADEQGEEGQSDDEMSFGGDDSAEDDFGGDDSGSDFGSEEDDSEEMPESFVREYVEKAPAPVTSEKNVNAKSIVAGKNDMGGTTKNIAKGGSNSSPDGNSAPKGVKSGSLPYSGKYENVPGANAGKAFNSAGKPVSKEVSGTNDKSPLAK